MTVDLEGRLRRAGAQLDRAAHARMHAVPSPATRRGRILPAVAAAAVLVLALGATLVWAGSDSVDVDTAEQPNQPTDPTSGDTTPPSRGPSESSSDNPDQSPSHADGYVDVFVTACAVPSDSMEVEVLDSPFISVPTYSADPETYTEYMVSVAVDADWAAEDGVVVDAWEVDTSVVIGNEQRSRGLVEPAIRNERAVPILHDDRRTIVPLYFVGEDLGPSIVTAETTVRSPSGDEAVIRVQLEIRPGQPAPGDSVANTSTTTTQPDG